MPIDLNHAVHFPTYHDLPHELDADWRYYARPVAPQQLVIKPKVHWCFLGEILRDDSVMRPVFLVKDSGGHHFRIGFYLDDESSFDTTKCKKGHTICIMYALRRDFVDGTQGIRIEDGESVQVLPCKLERLLSISAQRAEKSKTCGSCDNDASLQCSRCGKRYCSKECQENDWRSRHREECTALEQLRTWDSWDWDKFEGYK